MIEGFAVDDDADVTQIAEEDERPKLKFFALRRHFEGGPIRTLRSTLKIHSHILERAPDQSRTIKLFGASPIEVIISADVRLNRRQQRLVEGIRQTDHRHERRLSQRRTRQHSRRRNTWPLLLKSNRLRFQSGDAF